MPFQTKKVSIFFTLFALFSTFVSLPAQAKWFEIPNPFASVSKAVKKVVHTSDPFANYVCYEGQLPAIPNTQYFDPTKTFPGDDRPYMKGLTNMITAKIVKIDGSDNCYDYLTVKVGNETRHVQRMSNFSSRLCNTRSTKSSINNASRAYYTSAKDTGENGDQSSFFVRAYPISSDSRGKIVSTTDNQVIGKAAYSCGNFVNVNGVYYHTDLIQLAP